MQFIWAAAGTDKCCVIAGARGVQRIKRQTRDGGSVALEHARAVWACPSTIDDLITSAPIHYLNAHPELISRPPNQFHVSS